MIRQSAHATFRPLHVTTLAPAPMTAATAAALHEALLDLADLAAVWRARAAASAADAASAPAAL